MALDKPDRTPLFDLIPNDKVLQYFNGGIPVEIGDDKTGIQALVAALDGSRAAAFSPAEERVENRDDGRETRILRWTSWNERIKYCSSEDYMKTKKQELTKNWKTANLPYDTASDPYYQQQRKMKSWFGEDFYYLLGVGSPGLMDVWSEVGLEPFSYYLYDCEEVIIEQLEINTVKTVRWVEGLPVDDPFDCVFIGEDIAFKNGPMVRVDWLERHYFPRLKCVIKQLHAKGLKVMFHSDGNLNAIMDALIWSGIDALNPIEISAGMDLADLHRRYPKLVFAGGIDVGHLLPFGTPQQIRDSVVKAIEDTEGQILVGSSTEVFNIVPLENFLSMWETAINYSV
jgi:uroporphyrinogen decarboxylase